MQTSGIDAVITDICPTPQQTSVPASIASRNDAHSTTAIQSVEQFQVRWLPSMPLLNKRNTPPVAGIGILYSEESDRILYVFETDNLRQSINSCSRHQATALGQDPNCRISWYEMAPGRDRKQLFNALLTKTGSNLTVVG
jgi:hypothetical protein